jgi:hypothetical protein
MITIPSTSRALRPGLSGNFPDPCKSAKTGRIIDSAVRFDAIIFDKAF